MSAVGLVVLLGLAACGPAYREDGFEVGSVPLANHAPAAVHPAVLEYFFATPTGPLGAWHEAMQRARLTSKALRTVEAEARALADGKPPRAEHYARARARRMAAGINRVLAKNGNADFRCCERVDRRTGKLVGGQIFFRLLVDRRARIIHVTGMEHEPDYTWDLQYVPHAFEPERPLDYATVVRRAFPLHREEELR